MKRWLLSVGVLAGGLGLWAGFGGWGSDAATLLFQAGLAVFISANLLLGTWIWWRAKPDSGDAMVAPFIIFMSGAMLVGMLPRLVWPSNDRIQIVGSVVSAVMVIALAIAQVRKSRRLRKQAAQA